MFKRFIRSSAVNSSQLRLPGTYWLKYGLGAGFLGLTLLNAWCAYGVGAREDVEKVLVISERPDEYARWLAGVHFGPESQDTFAAQGRTFRQAEELGRAEDDDLHGLAAILHHADHEGFGLVALRLPDAHRHAPERQLQLAALSELEHAKSSGQPDEQTQWVVLTVGTLSDPALWTLGKPAPGIEFSRQAAAHTALLRALHAQPLIARRRTPAEEHLDQAQLDQAQLDQAQRDQAQDQASPSSARPVDLEPWGAVDYAKLAAQTISTWQSELGESVLASPLQQKVIHVLANGVPMLAQRPLTWQSEDGKKLRLAASLGEATTEGADDQGFRFTVDLAGRAPAAPVECAGLPDHIVDFALNHRGDALAVATAAGVQTFALAAAPGVPCQWLPRERSTHDVRFDGLGMPHPNGTSAGAYGARLWWRRGMQRVSTAPFAGVLRKQVHWLTESLVLAWQEPEAERDGHARDRGGIVVQRIDWRDQEALAADAIDIKALDPRLDNRSFAGFFPLDSQRVLMHFHRSTEDELALLELPGSWQGLPKTWASQMRLRTLKAMPHPLHALTVTPDQRWLTFVAAPLAHDAARLGLSMDDAMVYAIDLSNPSLAPRPLAIDRATDKALQVHWLGESAQVYVNHQHRRFGGLTEQAHRLTALPEAEMVARPANAPQATKATQGARAKH